LGSLDLEFGYNWPNIKGPVVVTWRRMGSIFFGQHSSYFAPFSGNGSTNAAENLKIRAKIG